MSGVVFCIACGQSIDDNAPLCLCDSERLTRLLVERIRETAPSHAIRPPPLSPQPVLGRRFDHVARLAARIATSRGGREIEGRDMVLACNEARVGEKPDGAA